MGAKEKIERGEDHMNWKRLVPWIMASLFCLLLGAKQAAAANSTPGGCSVAINSTFAGPIDLNAEGLTERSADIVISSANPETQTCFTNENDINVQWNAYMTVPAAPTALGDTNAITLGTNYYEVHDGSDTLGIAVTLFTASSGSGTATEVEVTVESGTLNAGATVVLKNLRFDMTGTVLAGSQSVPDGNPLIAELSVSQPIGTAPPLVVGNSKRTVNNIESYVDFEGFGYADGVCPFASAICGFPNVGGQINELVFQSQWSFRTNPAWSTDFPFRRVGENFGVSGDISSGPTDLVLDVENIPSGVTVTLPNELKICDAASVTWTTSGTPSNGAGSSVIGIYKTTAWTGAKSAKLTVLTAKTPDNGCDASHDPEIGVVINDPSGTGTASLRVVMGPAPSGGFAGDDVSASAIPRYIPVITDSAPSREIIGTDAGGTVPYFVVNPTQTVLLYPYVTNLSGWQTGIEVGNTGNDGTVFGNSGQSGALDFYFFPSNTSSAAAPFVYTVAAGVGRGLDGAGLLEPGGDFADTLSDLLSKAGHGPNFEGYVIVVAHFNFGHGAGMVFNTSGALTSVPALVLGGDCSFNVNVAGGTPNPWGFGSSSAPVCHSARQGDATKLPERLDQ